MTHDDAARWLDAYVEAWRSYDPAAIGALFADDAEYRYHPWNDPLRGRDAIVASWIGDRDEPGSWDATYEPTLIAGDRVIVTGETRYTVGRTFSNLWELTFDADGRCRDFVEWYMEHR